MTDKDSKPSEQQVFRAETLIPDAEPATKSQLARNIMRMEEEEDA